jgi:hypothetical protein
MSYCALEFSEYGRACDKPTLSVFRRVAPTLANKTNEAFPTIVLSTLLIRETRAARR